MSHSECISIIAAARVTVELPVASASFRISWVRRLVFNLNKQSDNLFADFIADFIANFMVTGPGREFTDVGVGIPLIQPYRVDRRNPEFADSITSTVPNPVSCSGTGTNVSRVFGRMRQSLRSGLLS